LDEAAARQLEFASAFWLTRNGEITHARLKEIIMQKLVLGLTG
jgi:hypothetical protein